ncbi:hypothetical protein ACFLYL_02285 [Chloroflexota bacterium]
MEVAVEQSIYVIAVTLAQVNQAFYVQGAILSKYQFNRVVPKIKPWLEGERGEDLQIII